MTGFCGLGEIAVGPTCSLNYPETKDNFSRLLQSNCRRRQSRKHLEASYQSEKKKHRYYRNKKWTCHATSWQIICSTGNKGADSIVKAFSNPCAACWKAPATIQTLCARPAFLWTGLSYTSQTPHDMDKVLKSLKRCQEATARLDHSTGLSGSYSKPAIRLEIWCPLVLAAFKSFQKPVVPWRSPFQPLAKTSWACCSWLRLA